MSQAGNSIEPVRKNMVKTLRKQAEYCFCFHTTHAIPYFSPQFFGSLKAYCRTIPSSLRSVGVTVSQ